jgi:hypothetical protein
MIRPRPKPCFTSPGALTEQVACTTQPITCRTGIAAAMRPSGSTDRTAPPSCGPPRPWKSYHGTPFIAVSTTVSGPSKGRILSARSGSDGPFTASTTKS